jgi:hypothetical protein
VKHATPSALDRLEPLLSELRALPALKERSRGAFYRGARAFLHFHEEGEALFADLRLGEDWERFEVTNSPGRAALKRRIVVELG